MMRPAIIVGAAALLLTGGYLSLPERGATPPSKAATMVAAESPKLSDPLPLPAAGKGDRTEAAARKADPLIGVAATGTQEPQQPAKSLTRDPGLGASLALSKPAENGVDASDSLCLEIAKYSVSESIASLETLLQQPNAVNGVTLCFIRVVMARITCMPLADAVTASEDQTRKMLTRLLDLPADVDEAKLLASVERAPMALKQLAARQMFQDALNGASDGTCKAADAAK